MILKEENKENYIAQRLEISRKWMSSEKIETYKKKGQTNDNLY